MRFTTEERHVPPAGAGLEFHEGVVEELEGREVTVERVDGTAIRGLLLGFTPGSFESYGPSPGWWLATPDVLEESVALDEIAAFTPHAGASLGEILMIRAELELQTDDPAVAESVLALARESLQAVSGVVTIVLELEAGGLHADVLLRGDPEHVMDRVGDALKPAADHPQAGTLELRAGDL